MAAEQPNTAVAASGQELNKSGRLGISVHIDRDREGDSRDDADRSRIQSTTSRQQPLLGGDIISDETLQSLIALASELKRVRRRLITEGYAIDGTRIYKPNENDLKN